MRCPTCRNGELRDGHRHKSAESNGRIAVVTDVPVTVCPSCETVWYAEDTAIALDELLRAMLDTYSMAVRSFIAPEGGPMTEPGADMFYDPNDIGSDWVVGTLISLGPRGNDASFDPQVGDWVRLVDADNVLLYGRVTARDGDRVLVQIDANPALED